MHVWDEYSDYMGLLVWAHGVARREDLEYESDDEWDRAERVWECSHGAHERVHGQRWGVLGLVVEMDESFVALSMLSFQ